MAIHLERDLSRLKREILSLGALVEEAVNRAITALKDRRPELAIDVLKGDDAIDAKEVEVEEECLKVLALHQPVATDLRFIVTVLKVNNDLERMGDEALNIAERAVFLATHPPLGVPVDLARLLDTVRAMMRGCLDALVHRDTMLARRVCARDDEVDDAYRALYGPLQEAMRKDPATVERATHLLSAARHLERLADLATNIAEDVVFLVEGEVIRHRYSQSPPDPARQA